MEMRITLRGYFLAGAAVYVDAAVLASMLRRMLLEPPVGFGTVFWAQATVFLLTFAAAPAVLALHLAPKRAFAMAGAAAAAAFAGDLVLLPLKLFAIPGLFATDLPARELVPIHSIEAMGIGAFAGVCAASAITLARGATWVTRRSLATVR
ncbi:MAG: hypothetical protein JO306_07825 [Gemmatimonadetes bacterium]|nr:hypothetical protein [Gemmatimonadota bacterium]